MKFISGEDRRISDAFRWDDWEIDDVVITLSGVGQPTLPTPRPI